MTTSPYYQRLGRAIDQYETAANSVRRDLRKQFWWHLFTQAIIPASLVVIAHFFSTVAGTLTTLGIGGLNFIERLRRGETARKTFWSDTSKLNRTVQTLKFRHALCDPNDNVAMREIEQLIVRYFDALLK